MKKYLPQVLSVLVCLLLVLSFLEIRDLRQDVQNLRNELVSQTSQVKSSVNAITDNIRSALEEEANLLQESDFSFSQVQVDRQTAAFHCRILPKTFSPDSTVVSLVLNGTQVPMTYDNGAYTLTKVVSLSETLSVSQVLLSDDGTVRSQLIHWSGSPREALLTAFAQIPASGSVSSGRFLWEPDFADIHIYQQGSYDLRRVELVEVLNGQEVGRLPVDFSPEGQKAYREDYDHRHRFSNSSYALPPESETAPADPGATGGAYQEETCFIYPFDHSYELSAGDTLVLYLDVVDGNQITYRSVVDCTSADQNLAPDHDWEARYEGSENPVVLLDADGTVVFNADPDLYYQG